MQSHFPSISVVTPLFNEAANLRELIVRLERVLRDKTEDLQIVVVDDGSSDGTAQLIDDIARENHSILGVELSRNFGQQSALTAGLQVANGEMIVVMDADLQDRPEDIPKLLDALAQGADVAYAIRTNRPEHPVLRCAYSTFYRLLGRLSDIEIPLDAGDFCAFKRNILLHLNALPEHRRFIRGLRSWVGFPQVGVIVERGEREAGNSKYTIRKLVGLAFDGLLAFSFVPLRVATFAGVAISVLAISLGIFYTIKKLSIGLNPPGFATIVVLLCFFTGVQLLTLGMIGEYLGRIYEEVKQRPHFIVRRVLGQRGRDAAEQRLRVHLLG